MASPRRTFLKSLSVGLVGATWLLLPGKARAWHRRGRALLPVCPQPVPESVIIRECPPTEVETYLLVTPSVAIAYPPQGPTNIPGSGGFCAWGTNSGVMSGIAYTRAFATFSGTTTEGMRTPSVAPDTFGFAFANVGAVNATGSVTVNGYNNLGQIIATTTSSNLTIKA